eukprot:scaffold652101_cov47-Prasinocladus_malaysianus.AAC.1
MAGLCAIHDARLEHILPATRHGQPLVHDSLRRKTQYNGRRNLNEMIHGTRDMKATMVATYWCTSWQKMTAHPA